MFFIKPRKIKKMKLRNEAFLFVTSRQHYCNEKAIFANLKKSLLLASLVIVILFVIIFAIAFNVYLHRQG